jgi:hypothetical protein
MNQLLEIVDSAPGLYLFAVAYLIYQVACSMRRQLSFISAWQDVFGLGTFMFLLLRRLVWLQPQSASEVMDALFRAIAFGIVAFALAGAAGATWMTVWRSIQRIQRQLSNRTERWRRARQQKRSAVENTPADPSQRAREVAQQRQQQEQRETESRKKEEDRQRRLDLRLQAELEMEFAADENRRKTFHDFINTYAEDSLPVELYEQRLAIIRDAAVRNAPARVKQYRNMQEIIDDFDRQLADVDQSTQSEFEKESLRSLILMERHNAIQRFIQP